MLSGANGQEIIILYYIIILKHIEFHLNCEGDRTQEQVAQRCCGDIKNPVDMVLSNQL